MRASLLDVPSVRKRLERYLLCSVATEEKRVALTFDDGPHPRHTPRLLDILGAKGIPATFFLVGRRVVAFPGLAREIATRGHEIGNHGYAHVPLPFLPGPLLEREVERAGLVIEAATGVRPRFFRPPLGWFTPGALGAVRRLGYEPVIGTVHPRDSSRPGAGWIVDHLADRVRPGAILILHDGGWSLGVDRSQSIEAADRIIDVLGARGYRFQTLSRLVEGGS
jgi:peptidoglycan/xylan/chitin deacetylase (PgdA/CDA1 family)